MARAKLSPQEWETFLELADRVGIDLSAFPNRQVRFTELESAGHRLGRAVAQLTTETLSLLAAARIQEPQPCPTCGQLAAVGHEERELETLDGVIPLHEPVCHCSACRRDFFPSASGAGTHAAEA
jgi:hypothetical protein